jgi:hypothetical protein
MCITPPGAAGGGFAANPPLASTSIRCAGCVRPSKPSHSPRAECPVRPTGQDVRQAERMPLSYHYHFRTGFLSGPHLLHGKSCVPHGAGMHPEPLTDLNQCSLPTIVHFYGKCLFITVFRYSYMIPLCEGLRIFPGERSICPTAHYLH